MWRGDKWAVDQPGWMAQAKNTIHCAPQGTDPEYICVAYIKTVCGQNDT